MNWKKITTYEAACKVNKQSPKLLPDVSKLPAEEAKDVINSLKLKRVIRALNYDPKTKKYWEPNWFDRNQIKYSPWVEVEATADKPYGVGFSRSYFGYWCAHSDAGSRLCLETRDKVMHLHKHFPELMKENYLILPVAKAAPKKAVKKAAKKVTKKRK